MASFGRVLSLLNALISARTGTPYAIFLFILV